ncbi:MAG: SPASM domain-containing protein [Deltaproteobacteria bacterium]|nr:SPASM domain-containing protein [Deltaproteobacteria bacterium]
MAHYFEQLSAAECGPLVPNAPVCLYLEVTNRCNLLCQTCPRTFASVEPPADLSLARFAMLVDQIDDLRQLVLHGVGEPLMNPELPAMIAYGKARGARVTFNSNATLLLPRRQRALIESGLDEYRVSLDAADAATFRRVRGRDHFDRIVDSLRQFVALKRVWGVPTPAISLWLVALRDTIHQLAGVVRLAADIGVPEVYLQRLVYGGNGRQQGVAVASQSLYGTSDAAVGEAIAGAAALAQSLGVTLRASGATTPEQSLWRDQHQRPWSHCRRPWTLMYITANGTVLPCCMVPFVERDLGALPLGNALVQPLAEIWNGPPYRRFRSALLSDQPPRCCTGCGVRWSL